MSNQTETLIEEKIYDDLFTDDHLQLRSEPHHRATLNCSPPALIWHLAFWPRKEADPQNAHNSNQYNKKLQDIVDKLNKVCVLFGGSKEYFSLKEPPKSQLNRKAKKSYVSTIQPKQCELTTSWWHFPVTTNIGVHSDFITISFTIDSESLPNAIQQESFQDQLFHSLESLKRRNVEFGTSSDFLFIEFWDRFARDCEIQILKSSDIDLRSIMPGEIFLNLRGVVVDARSHPSSDNPQSLINEFQNFITRGGFDNDDRDFVGTQILNDNAIFVSPFGAKLPSDQAIGSGQGRPKRITRFTILNSKNVNPHHLGRCVSNILDICTLMIAAMKDVHIIRQIGTQIRLAGDELNNISNGFSESVRIVGAPPRNLEKKIVSLESRLDNLSSLPAGGLAYRVYRSNYYVKELDRKVKSLRTKEIEGWQSLDAFFDKRLNAIFMYIQNVGRRMGNLRRRLNETFELIQTKTLVDLTTRVHKIHATSQLQNIILFSIAVSAFFGEVFEPLFQLGRNYPIIFEWIVWLMWAENLIKYVPETYYKCLPFLAENSLHMERLADVFRAPLDIEGDDRFCGPVFRLLGYIYGLIVAVICIIAYYTVVRGIIRIFGIIFYPLIYRLHLVRSWLFD